MKSFTLPRSSSSQAPGRPGSLSQAQRNRQVLVHAESDRRAAFITGGNTGMGYITARELAAKGFDITFCSRSRDKGEVALKALQEQNPAANFELRIMDLADLDTVKDLSKSLLDKGEQIDVLVNNAGVMACPEMQTKQGYEYQLGVNHLGHFALTAGLWPLIAQSGRAARVVNVSSDAHRFGDFNVKNPNLQGRYNNWLAYGQSKLANVMFTFELARRVPSALQVDTNTLHPGVVATELARYLGPQNPPEVLKAVGDFVGTFVKDNFLKTPEQGAATAIHVACAPELQGVTSKYFVDCKPSSGINGKAFDEQLRKQLWDISQEMTGVAFDVASGIAA